jgi:hypothetical protein
MKRISEAAFENRVKFSDKNDYEFFNFALCAVCVYFSFNNRDKDNIEWVGKNGCGDCRLMKAQGAYGGVMTTAVCNKFLSYQGRNIKGKRASVRGLPAFVKLVKDKDQVSVVLAK